MAVIVSTASGKGGVGKTLITASLGITLSRLGKKVLLIDGDMGLRNMDLILGLENDCFYNICDLAEGKCFLEDAVLPVTDHLDFLPASQKESWETVFPAAMDTVMDDIHRLYDFIFIDCPAGMGKGVETAFRLSDRVILLVAPSWSSRRNADRLLPLIGKGKIWKYVLNRFTTKEGSGLSFQEVYDTLDEESFGGVIPYSIMADRLGNRGEIAEFREKSAYGRALYDVLRCLLKDKDIPAARWLSSLRFSDRENEEETESKNDRNKRTERAGLSWHSSSSAYKWRRRR